MLNWKSVSKDYVARDGDLIFRLKKEVLSDSVSNNIDSLSLEVKSIKDIEFKSLGYKFISPTDNENTRLKSVDNKFWSYDNEIQNKATEILVDLFFIETTVSKETNRFYVSFSTLLSSEKVRKAISEMFVLELEDDTCVHDMEFVLEKLQEIEKGVNKNADTIILENMNFWFGCHDVIDVALDAFGYTQDSEASDFENYKWVMVKNR